MDDGILTWIGAKLNLGGTAGADEDTGTGFDADADGTAMATLRCGLLDSSITVRTSSSFAGTGSAGADEAGAAFRGDLDDFLGDDVGFLMA